MIESNHLDTIRRKANAAEKTSEVVADLAEDVEAVGVDIENLFENISDEYDPTKTYNVGDLCIAEGKLVKCNTAATTGEYDPTKWDATTIVENLGGGAGFKSKTWTGDGTGTLHLTFDTEPSYIFTATGPNGNGTTVVFPPFAWGADKIGWMYYGATAGIGSPVIEPAYDEEGYGFTLTDADYGKILNAEGQDYFMIYI